MSQVTLKRFETPDEVISFEKGRFEKITLDSSTLRPKFNTGQMAGRPASCWWNAALASLEPVSQLA